MKKDFNTHAFFSRNVNNCVKYPRHVTKKNSKTYDAKKNKKEQMNIKNQKSNEDMLGFNEEINSRMDITNISTAGSNQRGSY